jgi:Ca-activated chloride channel family protein
VNAEIRLERNMIAVEQGDTVHVMVELTAPPPPPTERAPLDVVAVVDRSASMYGAPLEAAKVAVEQLLRMLGPDDRLAVVAYDDEVRLVLGLTDHDAAAATAAIRSIEPGGSTNLAGGWLKAVELLSSDGRADATRTVLLLTDGMANVGLCTPAALADLCAGAQNRGIRTSTVGLGESFDEELLAAMADAGHGTDHYAASEEDLPKVFATEFDDLSRVVAHNVSLEVQLDERVHSLEVLGALSVAEVEHGVQIALGDAYGGERRRVLLAIGVPGLEQLGPTQIAVIVLRYTTVADAAKFHTVTMPVVVNIVDVTDVDNPDPAVTEEILVLRAAKARLDARDRLQSGDVDTAVRALRETAAALRDACADLPDATRIAADADELLRTADAMDVESTAHSSKALYSQSRAATRGRRPR